MGVRCGVDGIETVLGTIQFQNSQIVELYSRQPVLAINVVIKVVYIMRYFVVGNILGEGGRGETVTRHML